MSLVDYTSKFWVNTLRPRPLQSATSTGAPVEVWQWINNFTHTLQEVWRSEESEHNQRKHTVYPNGHGQSFNLGPSSACGDDPPISEKVVSSEHCKQASGC